MVYLVFNSLEYNMLSNKLEPILDHFPLQCLSVLREFLLLTYLRVYLQRQNILWVLYVGEDFGWRTGSIVCTYSFFRFNWLGDMLPGKEKSTQLL